MDERGGLSIQSLWVQRPQSQRGGEEGLVSNPRPTDNFTPGLHFSICEMGQNTGIWKPLPICGERGWRFPMGPGSAWRWCLGPLEAFWKEQCECVAWSPCPTPSLRAPSAQGPIPLDVSEALSQSPLHLLRALPGTAPPAPDLQAGMGPSKGKSSAKGPPPWADYSLFRKHHVLILDLPVQGQDVVIDERALG